MTLDRPDAGTKRDENVRVNDLALKLANVNGTGSASANGLLLQAIFRMGIPVSGKNLFPSNIQGLPTWYEIRVNGAGHTARATEYDLMVMMNAQTYAADIAEVSSGGYVLHDSTWPLSDELRRSDVHFLGVPITTMCNEHFAEGRERILMKNICYAGALVALLGIDVEIAAGLIDETFQRNARLLASNKLALRLGYEFALEHLDSPLPFRLAAMDANRDKVLIDGNTATALGCLYAGATVAAWYPITPATSVMDHFGELCARYRRIPDPAEAQPAQRNNYLILQAEDELAPLGMVIGAGWNGARAFTATSGPGISLMAEQLGLAYYAEIPAVVIEVQRAGPSTGMPTRTQQADLLACAYASHGDTRHLVLLPSDPKECFEDSVRAFDLAERFQTPVIVCSDLDIGMNDWVAPKLAWDDDVASDRGRVVGQADVARLERSFRYDPPDDRFVAARTLPGTSEAAAHLTRGGSGHDRRGACTESPDAYREVVDRLADKHRAAALDLPPPLIERRPGARVGVIAFGSSHPAVAEALSALAAAGEPLDYLRVRALPLRPEVGRLLEEHERCIVVEQNRDGQLRAMLAVEVGGGERLSSARCYGWPSADGGGGARGDRCRASRAPVRPGRRRKARRTEEGSCGPDQQRAHRAAEREGEAMTSIRRPSVPLLELEQNALGLTLWDYEGEPSTLCAGCGHDGLTAALVRALWERSLPPHEVVRISGIGCSSKIPTCFARGAHGFNSVHGRAAAIATGASAANRRLRYVVVSGDGDSLSIGLGHLSQAIRRNVHLTYVIANNGVYGLTKGQLSAPADVGSSSRHGEVNPLRSIDPMALGLVMGATFLARGFSGDRRRLVALLEAALDHRGFALVDVPSPCVQFGNHARGVDEELRLRPGARAVPRVAGGRRAPAPARDRMGPRPDGPARCGDPDRGAPQARRDPHGYPARRRVDPRAPRAGPDEPGGAEPAGALVVVPGHRRVGGAPGGLPLKRSPREGKEATDVTHQGDRAVLGGPGGAGSAAAVGRGVRGSRRAPAERPGVLHLRGDATSLRRHHRRGALGGARAAGRAGLRPRSAAGRRRR